MCNTWMDLEGTVLSDMSQTEKPYNVTSMGDLKRLNSRKETTDWWSAGAGGAGRCWLKAPDFLLEDDCDYGMVTTDSNIVGLAKTVNFKCSHHKHKEEMVVRRPDRGVIMLWWLAIKSQYTHTHTHREPRAASPGATPDPAGEGEAGPKSRCST